MPSGPEKWSTQYKRHVEWIKCGRLADVAYVVEELEERNRDKGLSQGEKRMLRRARNILEADVLLGLPDGWEGDDGQSGVREPLLPAPDSSAGPSALELPEC
jgi:hypothetical protein